MWLVKPKTLSENQWRELKELIKTTNDIKVYRRAKVILYRDAGYTAEEIHEHTEYSERAQQYWLNRYREEGIAGLYERSRSGRPPDKPPRVSREQEAEQEAEQEVAEQEVAEQEEAEQRLDSWARLTLELMYAGHPKRYMRHRAQMLLLRDDGYSAAEIADILGVDVRTVRQVLARYAREKLSGLYRKPGSGRISKLLPEQWKQIAEWIKKGPKALGYRFVKWTTRSLRKYIFKRFNVKLSREWIRQNLHRFIEYSWTRGKNVYAYPDDEERNADRKTFSQNMLVYLEQARKGEIILLFEDETILTLFGELGYSRSSRGKTQEVPSAGKRGRVVVFGAVEFKTGRPHYRIEGDRIHQESTLRFITQLVRYYEKHAPGIPVVWVLDKHPGHTAGLVADFVGKHKHVTLENTPTQSPDLNPIERVWDWLAELMMKNDFFETLDALKYAIRHFFCYLSGVKEQVISCLGNVQKLYSAEAGEEVKI